MRFFKKNIWLPFYLIVFIGTALLITSVYQKYNEILNNTKSEQLYLTKTYQNDLNSLLNEHETLHNLIAYEYVNNPSFSNETFKMVLKQNPLFVGIGIFSKEGELQLATLSDVTFPNLLQDKDTQQWFQETLDSEHMVIGRAYLQPNINKWILPIRNKILDNNDNILDNNDNIIGVISTGLDLEMLNQRWNKELPYHNTIQIILDNGAFPLLRTHLKTTQYPDYYNNALSSNTLFKQSVIQLKAQLRANLRANSEPFIQKIVPSKNGKTIYTLSYNNHYHFWTSAELPYQLVVQKLGKYCFVSFSFYLLLMIIMFTLLRWIARIEKSKIDELTYKSEHDTLTGLPNRIFLNKHFQELQEKQQAPFALLYIDLDNFKNINDTAGHSYGDHLLIEVAKRIIKSLATHRGVAARYSGDEFVVFIESENKEEIANYATSLLKSIAHPYFIKNNVFKISSSIGIARFPDDASALESLLSYADNSMFMAKKNKNHHLFFSKTVHHQLMRNTEIEQALHRAIMHDEISIVYQPQLDRKQKLSGVEALVRWHNEKLGVITPDIFIPIAEETGLMPKLGLYIIHRAMKEISALKKREGLAFNLSINVSARQFIQSDFI
ncbi:MAG: diguanylate cyclase, partial [Psychromonas sp.]|nr:diguanylate cyclase [Psychromonas sp.]